MISYYGLVVFCAALFSISCAGYMFSGNMLKKILFASLMFLAAGVLLSCLPSNDRPSSYYVAIFMLILGELAASFAIVVKTVRTLHTLDSGAIKGDD